AVPLEPARPRPPRRGRELRRSWRPLAPPFSTDLEPEPRPSVPRPARARNRHPPVSAPEALQGDRGTRQILPPDPSPAARGKHRPLNIHYWTEFQDCQQAAGRG